MGLAQKTCDCALEPPDAQSLCPEHTQGNRGLPAKSRPDLSKAGSRTRAALQAATCQHSLVEEVAHIFQNLLALVLNLSYKEEGLQYYRICSKILTVLSSFLKTVLQVANASTRLCTKVRIETTTVLKLEVSVSSKTAWDSKLGHNHHQPWDTWRKSEIQSALGIQSRLVSKLFRKVSKPHTRAQI